MKVRPGREGSVFCSQSHLIRSAQHNSGKLDIPSPPSSRGQQTFPQATRQWPPLASLRPLHRKPLPILSIASKPHCGISTAIAKYSHACENMMNWNSSSSPCHQVGLLIRKLISYPINNWLELLPRQLV